jgi:LDH2 family malate/lactate/ureidoglycolate dehydrogenase
VAVDIANTAVARGKIYLARQRGEEIPDSWALTPDGARTTDASAAVDGVILPMAGHKGYAISYMMDILSGALTLESGGLVLPEQTVEDLRRLAADVNLDATAFLG